MYLALSRAYLTSVPQARPMSLSSTSPAHRTARQRGHCPVVQNKKQNKRPQRQATCSAAVAAFSLSPCPHLLRSSASTFRPVPDDLSTPTCYPPTRRSLCRCSFRKTCRPHRFTRYRRPRPRCVACCARGRIMRHGPRGLQFLQFSSVPADPRPAVWRGLTRGEGVRDGLASILAPTTSPTLAILQPVLVMTASGKCHRDTCISCVRTDGSGQSGHRIPQATGLRSRDKPTLRSCHPHHTPDVETASRVQALPIPVLIFGDGSLLAHS